MHIAIAMRVIRCDNWVEAEGHGVSAVFVSWRSWLDLVTALRAVERSGVGTMNAKWGKSRLFDLGGGLAGLYCFWR